MIKCETIEKFNLNEFNKLKNIQRVGRNDYGTLYVGDTFECDEAMAKYLTGDNVLKKVVVKVIEIKTKEPKVKDAEFEEVPKVEKKTKKTSKSKK